MSSEKIIALYERLSREDENLGESYSIQNQKKLLEDFCREKGWTRFRHFTETAVVSGFLMILMDECISDLND